jgi:hypothetical protein
MAAFKTVFEELVLTSSLPIGLQMLRTRRALLDQNEGLGRPSPEDRAEVLEELAHGSKRSMATRSPFYRWTTAAL